jgi:hypothetical protein
MTLSSCLIKFAVSKSYQQQVFPYRRCYRSILDRFVNWVENLDRADKIGILFTPWGEALIHRYYQSTLSRLSHFSQIAKVAIQTNLYCNLDWIKNCNLDTLALWTTFHPKEVSRVYDTLGKPCNTGHKVINDRFQSFNLS